MSVVIDSEKRFFRTTVMRSVRHSLDKGWMLGVSLAATWWGCSADPSAVELPLLTADGTMEGVVQLHASPEIRIDGYAANLVPISWLGVSSDGTIAVFQSQDRVVRFFDEMGSLIATVGGEGEGPGEFRSLIRGGWKGDTLWVSDLRLRRVTLISPERMLVRSLPPLAATRPLPADSSSLPSFPFVFPYAVYANDSMLVMGLPYASDPHADALEGSGLLIVSSDGWIGRVAAVLPHSGVISLDLPDGGIAAVPIPFFPRVQWSVSPDGNVLVEVETAIDEDRGVFSVTMRNVLSGTSEQTKVAFEGAVIPDHVVDSVLSARMEEALTPEIRRTLQNDVRDQMPAVYPPVEELIVGNDHRVWLGLRVVNGRRPWLIVDAKGEPEGMVSLPLNSSVRAGRADYVWTIETDEFDVESVVRYHLEPQP